MKYVFEQLKNKETNCIDKASLLKLVSKNLQFLEQDLIENDYKIVDKMFSYEITNDKQIEQQLAKDNNQTSEEHDITWEEFRAIYLLCGIKI